MSYRLAAHEGPGPSVARVVAEQVDDALQRLEHELEAHPVEAVHGARKSIKKARAVLRLARPALRKRDYRLANASLRDAAHGLSVSRDADVLPETVAGLADRVAGQLPAEALAALMERFDVQAQASRQPPGAAGIEEARGLLDEVRARLADWPVDAVGWDAVTGGLVTAYREGDAERRHALTDPSAERLHEWRKRAKDLWYHQRLIRDAWPQLLKPAAEQAHELTEMLGDDHDLWVLREALTTPDGAVAELAIDVAPLLEVVDLRRSELQAAAFGLGERIYAERPKAFAARLEAYLLLWAQESPQAAPTR